MNGSHSVDRVRISRRDALLSLAAVPPMVALAPTALARLLRSDGRRPARTLVVVRLGGGNDGVNTVVPADDDRYHRARPTLRLPKERCVRLDGGPILHPSLEPLRALWDQGRLAVVESVGPPRPNRSHFESLDVWHTGRLEAAGRRTGVWARAVEGPDGGGPGASFAAVGVLDEEVPLALVGEHGAAPVIPDLRHMLLEHPAFAHAVAEALGAEPSGAAPRALLADATRAAVRASERLARVAERLPRDRFPPSAFGQRLRTVRALLEADLGVRVVYTALDGFDTHSRQAEIHAQLLSDLAGGLAAFQRELEESGQADRVVLVTFSEFGRRVAENGSRGTDHGAGQPLFVVGSRVRGGRHGEETDLGRLLDGDVSPLVDFRRVYAALLEDWLGVAAAPRLGGRFEPLALFA